MVCSPWLFNLPLLVCLIPVAVGHIGDENQAREWLVQYNDRAQEAFFDDALASWNYNTNLTDHNQKLMVEASLRKAKFDKHAAVNASQFNWRNFTNVSTKREFRKITDIAEAALSPEKVERFNALKSEMQRVYSTASVCGKPSDEDKSKCYPYEPDLRDLMTNSRNWDDLTWAWKGFRDQTGKKMKLMYPEFVQLLDDAARANGYKNNADYWQAAYETPDFEAICDRLFEQVKPLYEQLHAYAGRKLKQLYQGRHFSKTGHLPAHILGHMWAAAWGGIQNVIRPFPNKTSLDVTPKLKAQGYNATTIFQLAEEFFTSLNLIPMPERFWKYSMLEKPKDGRKVVCHASAWDFYNQKDFRIKQCTEVNQNHMVTAHHEMGHVEYYLQYKEQPVQFRGGGNPGFHEAIGDVMSLAVSTPEHLMKIGLLEPDEFDLNDTESDMNFLMGQALKKIAFIPFGYIVDKWRWSVFRGDTKPETYNTKWWELRCKYQGLAPPVKRTEADWDPGNIFHISANTPYIRYFVSYIIQFQFYKSLCDTAGYKGPLHRCDFYRSVDAGKKIGDMMKLGASRPWPDAMERLTGTRTMDAQPLMDYFRPLIEWLERQNEGHPVGWEEKCAT